LNAAIAERKTKNEEKQTKERLSHTQRPMNSLQLYTSSHKFELHSLTLKKYNVEILIPSFSTVFDARDPHLPVSSHIPL